MSFYFCVNFFYLQIYKLSTNVFYNLQQCYYVFIAKCLLMSGLHIPNNAKVFS